MKRPPMSFVVAHKRRPRTPTGEPASIWSDTAGRELRSLVRTAAEEDAQTGEAAGKDDPAAVERRRTAVADRSAPPRRILEARASADAIQDPVAPARARGRPRKPVANVVVEASPADEALTVPDQPEDAADHAVHPTPDAASVPASPAAKPSYRERRLAAQQALPLGERWKWKRGPKGARQKKH